MFFPEQRLDSKKVQTQKWQRYTEPGDELEPAASPMKRSSRNLADELAHDDDDDAPLPEAVLTTNLGLDIVVVVTKVRIASELQKCKIKLTYFSLFNSIIVLVSV